MKYKTEIKNDVAIIYKGETCCMKYYMKDKVLRSFETLPEKVFNDYMKAIDEHLKKK